MRQKKYIDWLGSLITIMNVHQWIMTHALSAATVKHLVLTDWWMRLLDCIAVCVCVVRIRFRCFFLCKCLKSTGMGNVGNQTNALMLIYFLTWSWYDSMHWSDETAGTSMFFEPGIWLGRWHELAWWIEVCSRPSRTWDWQAVQLRHWFSDHNLSLLMAEMMPTPTVLTRISIESVT